MMTRMITRGWSVQKIINCCSELNLRVTYSQDKLLKILIGRKEHLAKIAATPHLPVNLSNLNREYEFESN